MISHSAGGSSNLVRMYAGVSSWRTSVFCNFGKSFTRLPAAGIERSWTRDSTQRVQQILARRVYDTAPFRIETLMNLIDLDSTASENFCDSSDETPIPEVADMMVDVDWNPRAATLGRWGKADRDSGGPFISSKFSSLFFRHHHQRREYYFLLPFSVWWFHI